HAGECADLDQRPYAFLDEQRIPFGPGDEQRLEDVETRVLSYQCAEKLVSARGRQRVDPKLAVVRLGAPPVLVLRAIVHRQQNRRRRKIFDETVEKRLRLGIDPVEIFKDDEQRLHLAFAQQHRFYRGQRAPPPIRRIEREKWTVPWERIEKPEDGRDRFIQCLVERQEVTDHLGADRPGFIAAFDLEIASEKVRKR